MWCRLLSTFVVSMACLVVPLPSRGATPKLRLPVFVSTRSETNVLFAEGLDISRGGFVAIGTARLEYSFVFPPRTDRAFRWPIPSPISPIDVPAGSTGSKATAVSADGSTIVGTVYSSLGQQVCRWKGGQAMGLGDLPGGAFSSAGSDVSADGSVVVGYASVPNGHVAFRWTEATGMVSLGDLAPVTSPFSSASAVSADGSVVVGAGSASFYVIEAFRWEDGAMIGLGDLPGGAYYSAARDVSADGAVVVGVSESANGREAFRWTEETGIVGLGDLPGWAFESEAYGVSEDGSLVVGRGAASGGTRAAVWTERDGMRPATEFLADHGLSLRGSNLLAVQAVSDDGSQIAMVGSARAERGDHAWVAVVPSRPCDDGRDNDRDGLMDTEDPGCALHHGASEGVSNVDVAIDIAPGTSLNEINLFGQEPIPVAVLGSNSLDVSDVDVTSLAFGAGQAASISSFTSDVNLDGSLDLVTHFPVQEAGIAFGDTHACISGSLLDGANFTSCDAITSMAQVQIDTRPGIDPNLIDPMGRGLIPVAVLGSTGLDVADIDSTTLRFGPDEAVSVFAFRQDVSRDGHFDLVAHFWGQQAGLAFGDTELCLLGELLDGTPFVGCDAIVTVPSCGIGYELIFVLPPLMWLQGRRRVPPQWGRPRPTPRLDRNRLLGR